MIIWLDSLPESSFLMPTKCVDVVLIAIFDTSRDVVEKLYNIQKMFQHRRLFTLYTSHLMLAAMLTLRSLVLTLTLTLHITLTLCNMTQFLFTVNC